MFKILSLVILGIGTLTFAQTMQPVKVTFVTNGVPAVEAVKPLVENKIKESIQLLAENGCSYIGSPNLSVIMHDMSLDQFRTVTNSDVSIGVRDISTVSVDRLAGVLVQGKLYQLVVENRVYFTSFDFGDPEIQHLNSAAQFISTVERMEKVIKKLGKIELMPPAQNSSEDKYQYFRLDVSESRCQRLNFGFARMIPTISGVRDVNYRGLTTCSSEEWMEHFLSQKF